MAALHLPILRHGEAYTSLDLAPVPDVRSGPPAAFVSLANAGMIRRDAARARQGWEALIAMPTAERIARTVAAADLFRSADLPVGDTLVGPEQHAHLTSRSTGLPVALVRRNLDKVYGSLASVGDVVRGLSRGVPPEVLDRGEGVVDGVAVGFVQVVRSLGAVLPSNSPGVHTLWTAAPALGVPVVLKPGRGDPWTPLRVIAAMTAAGLPASAFGFYPSDHEGGGAVVERHDRVMVFGGAGTVKKYAGDPRVEVHGPGFSKVVIGADVDPEAVIEAVATSIANNGGRSCINASTVVLTGGADAFAQALAERLARTEPLDLDDPDASLAAFTDGAEAIDARIDEQLAGAVDVSARVRGPQRLVRRDGLVFLRPTVVRCPPDHALARTEYPFPFVAVVELPQAGIADWLGPTLVASVFSGDVALWRQLSQARHVDRLHRGCPTTQLRWDQPHEGNLFDACWRRRGLA